MTGALAPFSYLVCNVLLFQARLYLQVVRHYHGHLSAVYALALHPTIDVLVNIL
jgi:hypothetical protein